MWLEQASMIGLAGLIYSQLQSVVHHALVDVFLDQSDKDVNQLGSELWKKCLIYVRNSQANKKTLA